MTHDTGDDIKALAERLRAVASAGCSHDMGFDRELGPIGCDLDIEGRGGCFCAGMVPAMREAADALLSAQSKAEERDVLLARLDTTGTGDAVPANLAEALANIAALEAGVTVGVLAQSALAAAEARANATQEEAAGLRVDLAEADKVAQRLEALLDPHISWEGQPSAYDAVKAKLADAVAVMEDVDQSGRIPSGGIRRPATRIVVPANVFSRVRTFLTSIKETGNAR